MWSLPDINRMNANAAATATKLKREAARKRKPQCARASDFTRGNRNAARAGVPPVN